MKQAMTVSREIGVAEERTALPQEESKTMASYRDVATDD